MLSHKELSDMVRENQHLAEVLYHKMLSHHGFWMKDYTPTRGTSTAAEKLAKEAQLPANIDYVMHKYLCAIMDDFPFLKILKDPTVLPETIVRKIVDVRPDFFDGVNISIVSVEDFINGKY